MKVSVCLLKMEDFMKRIVTLLVCCVFLLCACGKPINQSTMGLTAKSFVQALIEGNSQAIELMNKSTSLSWSTDSLVKEISPKFTDTRLDDYKFDLYPYNDIVKVSKSDNESSALYFEIKKIEDKFYFFNIAPIHGYLVGTLINKESIDITDIDKSDKDVLTGTIDGKVMRTVEWASYSNNVDNGYHKGIRAKVDLDEGKTYQSDAQSEGMITPKNAQFSEWREGEMMNQIIEYKDSYRYETQYDPYGDIIFRYVYKYEWIDENIMKLIVEPDKCVNIDGFIPSEYEGLIVQLTVDDSFINEKMIVPLEYGEEMIFYKKLIFKQ